MAENKEGQDKTEAATPKRTGDAEMRGQVAKSQDITTAAVLLLGGLTVFWLGKPMLNQVQNLMKNTFSNLTSFEFTDVNVVNYFTSLLGLLAQILLPILVIIGVIAYGAEVSQVGFKLASKKFTEGLNFSMIFNPFGGIKRILFSSRSLFELAKSIVKLFILGYVVYTVLERHAPQSVSLVEMPYIEIGAFMASVSIEIILKVGAVFIIIAFIDLFYQRYKYKEDLKMTKQEVKEENKQTEGDVQVKQRIRSLMRGRIRKLMMKNVKNADVVITNPTHYAVALSYKPDKMSAPVLVAKGVDYLAFQIRDIAQKNDIPIVEEPPLARAIYFSVEIDREIPENLFKAVAQVLAYIFHLKKKIY